MIWGLLTQSILGVFSEHGAFKLRKRTHNLHHHTASGRGGIDGFGQTLKTCVGVNDLF